MPMVQRFQCDNPRCDQEAMPEDGGTKKHPATPYNWYEVNVLRMGSGSVTVTVCSMTCIHPAIEWAEMEAIEAGDR